ncbi:MAG TPA: MFS transporter [Polyangiaceae bacterium]|nr:MFS transporter [Polyangiaceae bacterium]
MSDSTAEAARPFPTRLFAFAFLGWAFDFYDLVLFGFIKDRVSRDLGLSHHLEPWLLGVALSTSGLGGIVGGRLADRFGKRSVLALTIAVYSLGSLVCGLAPTIGVFIAGRALVGLGVGGEWAIGHGMLAEAVAPGRRGRASALLQAGEPVGVAIAAVAGFVIVPIVGWRAVLVASSATAMLAFFARRSLHLPSEPTLEPAKFRKLLTPGLPSRLVRGWLLGVFKLGTYWSCYTWLPTFLLTHMHQSTGKSLTWMITAQVGQFSGMLMFGRFADRFGRRIAFACFSLLTAAALAPLAFAWQALSATPILFWSAMLMLGFGSGCTAGFGALLAELFPTELRGLAMGSTYNLARTAQLGAPVLVAWAVERAGLAGGLGVPLVLALLTASWVWTLPETRGIRLPTLADRAPEASV